MEQVVQLNLDRPDLPIGDILLEPEREIRVKLRNETGS
jgi:hypothetical protein